MSDEGRGGQHYILLFLTKYRTGCYWVTLLPQDQYAGIIWWLVKFYLTLHGGGCGWTDEKQVYFIK